MAIKYLDNLNSNAADTVSNGTEAAPYLTLAYAESQCSDGDTLYVGNGTTYDVGDGTAFTLDTAITIANWANRDGPKPKIEGGDATRLIYVNEAGAVVLDGLILENDRTGNGSYVVQAHSVVTNLTIRNCDIIGSATLGAIGASAGAVGVVIESSCRIRMNSGGATYISATASIACYAQVELYGAAQAAHFISNGSSAGYSLIYGGKHALYNINNYVIRCGATNSASSITIHSSFHLVVVPTNYDRSCFDIQDPTSFITQPGAIIDTTNSLAVSGAEVWVRAKTGVSGSVNISGLKIYRKSIVGYGIKIGDESPFSTSHTANSMTSVIIDGCEINDGIYYGISGVTQTHMIFIGNENMYKVKNNIVNCGAYGIGIKGDSTADSSSYVYNNIVKGCRLAHLKTKGISGTRWVNNLVIEDNKGGDGLEFTENTDDGASGVGNLSFARNNIFVMDTGAALEIDAVSDDGTNDSDYNSFYIASGIDIAAISGVGYSTILSLQSSKRLELHSRKSSSTDPILDSSYLPVIDSINYQTGMPILGIHEIKDTTGSITLVTSGTINLIEFVVDTLKTRPIVKSY